MKKVLIIILVAVVLIGGIYFIGSGFTVRNDAVLYNFSVSKDECNITLNVGVSSSAGYIRAFKDKSDEEGKIKLNFYSAFGGINGSIGSRNSFDIPLSENSNEIYFCRGEKYELILYKNESGQWKRA